MCGRAVIKPHRSRSDEDRAFGRERIPTVSFDYCFLGSADDDDDKKAHGSPFLVLFDRETEAGYAIAAADKACKPWIVEYVCSVLNKLGYSGIKVALKRDAALELRELEKLAAAKRSCATVPMEVPARESKANGAVERAVRTWQGQLQTLKSHFEPGIDMKLPREHPILQWCAW